MRKPHGLTPHAAPEVRRIEMPLPESAADLLQELQAVEVFSRLQLSRTQMASAGQWIERGVGSSSGIDEAIAAARDVVAGMEQERDALAAHAAVSPGVLDKISDQQFLQKMWTTRRARFFQNAAQSLLFGLSDDQRRLIASAPYLYNYLDTARTIVTRANQANVAAAYTQFRAGIKANYPADDAEIGPLLDKAHAMQVDEVKRKGPAIAWQIAMILRKNSPYAKNPVTDSQVATQLVELLQHPAIQEAVLTSIQNPSTPGSAANSTVKLTSAIDEIETLSRLEKQQSILSDQMNALRLLPAIGFTLPQLRSASSWFEKADSLRAEDNKTNGPVSEIKKTTRLAMAAVAHGQIYPPEDGSDAPDLGDAVQYQQYNLRADLQLAAMALLNYLPPDQVSEIATGASSATRRIQRVEDILSSVRAYSLYSYLSNEASFVRQIDRRDNKEADAKIQAILRSARLLTDAEFEMQSVSLALKLTKLVAPRTVPATPARLAQTTAATKPAAGITAGLEAPNPALSPDTEKQEELLNTAAERLGPFLDIPGLSTLLWVHPAGK